MIIGSLPSSIFQRECRTIDDEEIELGVRWA
jgi:hypothetical protein